MSKLVWNRELKKYIDVTDPSNLNFLNKKYKLTTCRPNNTFSRGEEVHVILETKNVPQGTCVPFSIETSSEDSEIFSQNLKGNFVVGNLDENFVSKSKLILNVSNKNLSTRKEIALLKLDDSKEKVSITLDFSKSIPSPVEKPVVEEPVAVVEKPVVEEPVAVVEKPVVDKHENKQWNFNKNRNHKNKKRK